MAAKKISILLLTLIFVIAAPFVGLAQIERNEGIDALLLLDTSGSMRESDSSRNAIEATKMFIDMLETKNSRVGIIAFNDSLTNVVDITEIDSIEDKEHLKAIVDGFDYSGWTDIGLSLKEAVSMISGNMRTGNSPMILLLTDGKIEMGENSERSPEESYDDVISAISEANKELPIYTIGLNYDGSVDRQLLRTISESTGGRDYIISQASDLPQIFNEIFADHIKSSLIEIAAFTAEEGYIDVDIEIDSDYVAVANIIMLSEQGILDARVLDPDGNEAVFDQTTVTFSNSRKYSIVKLLFPQRGEWLLQVLGVTGDQVRVNLIYQYDISVELELTQDTATERLFDSSAPVTITGRLLVNGQPVHDDSLYSSTVSTAVISDLDGNLLASIPLTSDSDGLSGIYTPENANPVSIYIETTADTFSKSSSEIILQFEEPAQETPPAATPEPTPEPTPESTPKPESNESTSVNPAIYALPAVAVLILAFFAVKAVKRSKKKFFDGYIEVRAMSQTGVYTSVEIPTLNTYVGTIELSQFLVDSMPTKVLAEIASLPFSVKNILLTPASTARGSAIALENKSGGLITGNDGAIGKTAIWYPDEKMTITNGDDSSAKLELTYRVEEL